MSIPRCLHHLRRTMESEAAGATTGPKPPAIERRSIAYELGRMDSLISNASNDSSLMSMEIEDQFVGMNLDKNFNDTTTAAGVNNEVRVHVSVSVHTPSNRFASSAPEGKTSGR